jgi:hypothetical protein
MFLGISYYYKLLRNRNMNNIQMKIKLLGKGEISYERFIESFQGWNAYAKWADSFKLRREIANKIYFSSTINLNKYLC